jgi:hypothetical protein
MHHLKIEHHVVNRDSVLPRKILSATGQEGLREEET